MKTSGEFISYVLRLRHRRCPVRCLITLRLFPAPARTVIWYSLHSKSNFDASRVGSSMREPTSAPPYLDSKLAAPHAFLLSPANPEQSFNLCLVTKLDERK